MSPMAFMLQAADLKAASAARSLPAKFGKFGGAALEARKRIKMAHYETGSKELNTNSNTLTNLGLWIQPAQPFAL